MSKWVVFAPSERRVMIKHDGRYYFFNHRQEISEEEEESFFIKYPRIFKRVGDTKIPKNDKRPTLNMKIVSKGWYVVVDENDNQIFPIDGSKIRKKQAENYIEENING